jgi:hypothetical protein
MSVIENISIHHRAAYLMHFNRNIQSTKCTYSFDCHGKSNKRNFGKCEGSKTVILEHADEIAMRKLSPLFLSTSLC